ncbi:DUF1708 domain-containing protein Ecym_2109 [Eremothecium cymbalariae DBVPG|uniref:Meiotically up-regulated protein Msb1/Mug8 domain-containing protein n=1 Tax=Eremothecium cymbalariae (strain CBS 270.75 / DBVPG 7215 / KCTC 17166 / NRRL Y-17582) TaxID=931890 RepID=G8JPL3_ERECY|nr:Hypothetical protein Ecym_2109 [Eremothecium cymbalariae DBVPG\
MFRALRRKINHGKHSSKNGDGKGNDDEKRYQFSSNGGNYSGGNYNSGNYNSGTEGPQTNIPVVVKQPKQKRVVRNGASGKPQEKPSWEPGAVPLPQRIAQKELYTAADIHSELIKMDVTQRLVGRYYVYNVSVFRGPGDCRDLRDPNFNIFQRKGAINPISSRYVIYHLATYFKERLNSQLAKNNCNNTDLIRSAMEIFKPNLSHYSHSETKETKRILASFFPWDGCSLAGKWLQLEIEKHFGSSWNKLILALRIMWSELPQGIVPWESFSSFKRLEQKYYFPVTAFYNFIPQVLPSRDFTCIAYSFLEILVTIIGKTDLVVEKTTQMDLVFTAGQVCFTKSNAIDEYMDSDSGESFDVLTLNKIYYARGSALYHLFVSYLRSLVDKGKIKDFYLIDNFNVEQYPPAPYTPMTQRALTLTVPKFLVDDEMRNDFNHLIKLVSKASSRIYSSHHAFSKLENSFLDKFEENPLKVIESLFSKSSKRYLYKLDKQFSTNYFKTLNEKQHLNRALQELDPNNQYAVATWIESCKQHGFSEFLSMLEDNMGGDGTLVLGHPFLNSLTEGLQKEEEEEVYPVKLSKMGVSEWFISSWKYEMFLGKIHNTLVIKLTKRVGDCDWIVISTDERMASSGPSPPLSQSDSRRSELRELSHVKPNKQQLLKQCNNMRHSISEISLSRVRPPPLNLLGEHSSSPLMEDDAPTPAQKRLSCGSSAVNTIKAISRRSTASTTDATNHEDTQSVEHAQKSNGTTGTSDAMDSTTIGNSSNISHERARPPQVDSIMLATQPMQIGQNYDELYTPTGGAYVVPRPSIPMKTQNPSINSLSRSVGDHEISIITEESETDAEESAPNDTTLGLSYAERSHAFSSTTNTSSSSGELVPNEDSVEVSKKNIAKPIDFTARELYGQVKLVSDMDKQFSQESNGLKSPVNDIKFSQDKNAHSIYKNNNNHENNESKTPDNIVKESATKTDSVNRNTIIVYPQHGNQTENASGNTNEMVSLDKTIPIHKNGNESRPVTIQDKGGDIPTNLSSSPTGSRTSSKDSIVTEEFEFINNSESKSRSHSRLLDKKLPDTPTSPSISRSGYTNDFLDDFIDGYDERSNPDRITTQEITVKNTAEDTLFEKVKNYYEQAAIDKANKVYASAISNTRRGTSSTRYGVMPAGATAASDSPRHTAEGLDFGKTPCSYTPSVKSFDQAFNARETSATNSFNSSIVLKDDTGIFNSDEEDDFHKNSDYDVNRVSKFKSALLKTKRSIRGLNGYKA